MSKLISANFVRLKKDKVFWGVLIFMTAAGVFLPVTGYADMRRSGYIVNLDSRFFFCSILVVIAMAVFCSLFIGTEYSDGTVRNKVVTGHKRSSIYLANFAAAAITGAAACAVYFAVYLCVGIPLLGFFAADGKTVLLLVLAVFMLAVAFSSIFTMISMSNQSKAAGAVTCILLAAVLLLVGVQLNKSLSEPETNAAMVMTEDGRTVEEVPNPKYLDEEARKTVQFFYDLLPGSQAVQCAFGEVVNLPFLPVYSLLVTALSTGAGLCLFKRKDLR